MTPLETELAHLVRLMEPPYRENWKAYCWAKANALESRAEFAGLASALAKQMQSDSSVSGQKPESINQQRSE